MMKRLYQTGITWFYHLKLRYKLALTYFLVTMLPVAAIGYISYTTTLSYVKKQNVTLLENTQIQYNNDISNRLTAFTSLAQSINLNRSIQDYLFSQSSSSYLEYSFINDFLTPFLTALLQATGVGVHLDLVHYNPNYNDIIYNYVHGTAESAANPPLDSRILSGRATFNLYKAERVANKAWFTQIEETVFDFEWQQISDDAQNGNITLVKPLFNFLYTIDKPIGYILITVKLGDILENSVNTGENGDVFHLVFDGEETLLSQDMDKQAFYKARREEIQPFMLSSNSGTPLFLEDYVILKGKNPVTGWSLLTVAPIKTMNDSIARIRNMTLLYCMLALIILFVVTNLVAGSFSSRITDITKRMQRLHSHNLKNKAPDAYNDEIGYLARTFNEMMARMDSLIRDNYQANIDRKEAQLKALQAQINPHFLYNSLSCISRLGNRGDRDSINKMVRALTTFYRMTLNKGHDLIKVADELEQVKAYTQIYKIRKGEDFNIYYHINEEALAYDTIKVILQPFIENILEHAVYMRESPININLNVCVETDSLIFEIIDDGVGMSEEKIALVFAEQGNQSGGYGIKNVDDRIKLQFGNQYGVSLFSRPGIGTKVQICIPRYTRQKDLN